MPTSEDLEMMMAECDALLEKRVQATAVIDSLRLEELSKALPENDPLKRVAEFEAIKARVIAEYGGVAAAVIADAAFGNN